MRTRLFFCFLGLAATCVAGGPSWCDATYKLNVAKSKVTAGDPLPKDVMVVCKSQGDLEDLMVTGTDGAGKAISEHSQTPKNGGAVKFLEGGPPANSGVTVTTKVVNERNREGVIMKDGKQVATERLVMSKDGKTIERMVKGVDEKGKPVDTHEYYERQ